MYQVITYWWSNIPAAAISSLILMLIHDILLTKKTQVEIHVLLTVLKMSPILNWLNYKCTCTKSKVQCNVHVSGLRSLCT